MDRDSCLGRGAAERRKLIKQLDHLIIESVYEKEAA